MTTPPNTELFVLTPAPVLPAATFAALQDIPVAEKRAWITSILTSAVVRRIDLDVLRRSLVGERLARDLIERIVDTLRDRGAAS